MKRVHLLILVGAAVLAHLLILMPLPLVVQALAALVLCGLIPGLLLVEAVVGRSAAPPGPWERTVTSIGAGYGVMVVMLLLASYLPGPLMRWQTFAAFDSALIVLLAVVWVQARQTTARSAKMRSAPPQVQAEWREVGADWRWLLAGALVLVALAILFRFTGLGYSDFQGDEARAALRAAATIQGYDDVLMLHKKGPTEILLPTLIFSLTGHLDETTARLPFAIANFAALFAIWLLGWRLFHPLAGWLTAMLLALDGYFIGFARIVQYQSVVLLMAVLAVYVLVRLLQRTRALSAWLSLAAVFLATGILSHYEGALPMIPAAFLLGVIFWRNRTQWKPIAVATLIAAAVGGALLAVFYLPYVFDEHFSATWVYLTDRRIGGHMPYNNLADVFLRTTLYSTAYMILLLIGVTLAGIVRIFLRGWSRIVGVILSLAAVALVAITFWNPQWALVGETDWIIVPFTLLLALVIFTPRQRSEERAIWLWFAAIFILSIFLTEKPRTHIYNFFIPWFLICGELFALAWLWLREKTSQRTAAIAGVAAAAAVTLIAANYAWQLFIDQNERLLHYDDMRPAGYWTVYDEPDDKARFGFPLNNAWKVVGELYRTGEISGPYDSTEKEAWVPAWYTDGYDRCQPDAEWFFEIRNLEPWSRSDQRDMESYLREGFVKWSRVQVDGEDKMIVYKRTGEKRDNPAADPVDGLPILRFEDFAASFDANTSPNLPLTYPVVEPAIANPLHFTFGDQIRLEGYAIDYPKPLRQGDDIYLTLYWRGLRPIDESWKVFNQVIYGDGPMIAQRDGFPVCASRTTDQWDPGELITDRYRIPVSPDAPDGLYPLNTGLYLESSGERLPVTDAEGNDVGTQVHITDIRVGDEP